MRDVNFYKKQKTSLPGRIKRLEQQNLQGRKDAAWKEGDTQGVGARHGFECCHFFRDRTMPVLFSSVNTWDIREGKQHLSSPVDRDRCWARDVGPGGLGHGIGRPRTGMTSGSAAKGGRERARFGTADVRNVTPAHSTEQTLSLPSETLLRVCMAVVSLGHRAWPLVRLF